MFICSQSKRPDDAEASLDHHDVGYHAAFYIICIRNEYGNTTFGFCLCSDIHQAK